MKILLFKKYDWHVLFVFIMLLCLPVTSSAFIYLDPSFGSNHNGYEIITSGISTIIYKVAFQPDGKMVLAGLTSMDEASSSFFTTRYSDAGIDTTFGNAGVVVQQVGVQAGATGLVIQPDGKIVVGGYSFGDSINSALIRYLTDGTLDAENFGDNGVVLTTGESGYYANDVVLQSDGKIVIAGGANTLSGSDMLLARYSSDGSLDQNYGSSGITLTTIGSYAGAFRAILQTDGKILVSGTGYISNVQNGIVARYNSSGSLDTSEFNNPTGYVGQSVTGAEFTWTFLSGMAKQSDGKIIFLSQYNMGELTDVSLLARYNADGTLDESFGANGYVYIDPAENINKGYAVTVDANDRIVVVGTMLGETSSQLIVVRFLADGSGWDTTFGNEGIVTAQIGTYAKGFSVNIQDDGKIVVVGTTDNNSFVVRLFASSSSDFVGIALPKDGTTITDPSFTITGYASQANMTVKLKVDDVEAASFTSDAVGYWNAGSFITVNGTHTLTAELWDGTTLLATSVPITIIVSLTIDAMTIASPTDGSSITTAMPLVCGGSTRATAPVRILLDGYPVFLATTNAQGIWTIDYALMLGNGERTIFVELMDGTTQITNATSTVNVTSSLPPISSFGNVIPVDAQFGSDVTCGKTTTSSPFYKPCLTVGKALSLAQPGDEVLIFPGVYNEAQLTLSTGTAMAPTAVRGMDPKTTIIQKTGAVADTDLIIMGEYSSLSDVTLKLASNEHHLLRGIVFPGTTSVTSSIKDVELTVDNAAASAEGTSHVYGIHSVGTGRPDVFQQAIASSKIVVQSIGAGNKRALLVNQPNTIYSRDSIFSTTCPHGYCLGSYIGIETNETTAIADIRRSDIEGYIDTGMSGYSGMNNVADIAQSAGTLQVDLCSLANANAAGLEFSGAHQTFMFWGIDGLLPDASPQFVRFGSGSTLGSVMSLSMHKLTLVKSLRVQLVTPPSGASLTFTILKNGIDTDLSVTIAANGLLGVSSNTSVTFNAGDTIALKLTNDDDSAGGARDAVISVETY